MSRVKEGRWDDLLLETLETLAGQLRDKGALTFGDVEAAEAALSPMAGEAKEYDITCAAHAHIDMNWMWGYQETASVVVDTFRTMLTLMEEYPEFTFSQSQASVYEIVEKYYPEMLEAIWARVREGRWEVTASSWVENDKNMSGSEAMIRHLLCTKTYLSGLLGIPESSLDLDFEPDTFGHSANLPEVLASGGVRYYYHCRGNDSEFIYRWRAPSGAEVLVYREPDWYLGQIEYGFAAFLPELCRKTRVPKLLKVYGVGDHGGGPTRRDLKKLLDMAGWPLYPRIRFGTIRGFFQELEAYRDWLPVVDRELNYIFTGCYTSQSEIKKANRTGENRLFDAEALDAMAAGLCRNYRTASSFEPAWRKLLFNQFHDILPGSGKAATRDFALGQYQSLMTTVNINATHSMTAVCKAIDTSGFFPAGEPREPGTAMGAGVGFETAGKFPVAERNDGDRRAYTVFNPLPFARKELCPFTIWDWQGDGDSIEILDERGTALPVQVLGDGRLYWGHHFYKVLAPVEVPGFGYATYFVRKRESRLKISTMLQPRQLAPQSAVVVLENEKLRAEFCKETMELISLFSKEDRRELLKPGGSGGVFRLITEETSRGMTSWRVGDYVKIRNLNREEPVFLTGTEKGPLRQSAAYTLRFGRSAIQAEVSLDAGSDVLRFDVTVDWQETGDASRGVPQLNFYLPLGAEAGTSCCGIPFGTIRRPAMDQDVPCLGWMAAEGEYSLLLMSDAKYGYRCDGKSLAVSLIRGSYDPDPYPEYGEHKFALGVSASGGQPLELLQKADRFAHPLTVCSTGIHGGDLALRGGLLRVEGPVSVTGLKISRDRKAVILRMFNPGGETAAVRVAAAAPGMKIGELQAVDALEEPVPGGVSGGEVLVRPFGICAVRVGMG